MNQMNTRNFRMANLASVSRSGGLEKDGNALKDWATQGEYRRFIDEKVETFWTRFPASTAHAPIREEQAKSSSRVDAQENILILFRKLREGISSSRRTDMFAVEAYETSLYLSIIFSNDKQTTSIIPALIDLLRGPSNSDKDQSLNLTLTSLHYLVVSYPSQTSFRGHGKSLSGLKLTSSVKSWLDDVTTAFRRSNWASIGRLLQPQTYKPLFASDDDPRHSMPMRALDTLVAAVSYKARETTWKIICFAYRELSCAHGSESRSWLEQSLGLQDPHIWDGVLISWMEEKAEIGDIRAKEGAPDRWMIVKRR